MKRIARKEMGTFSASAIDLFASALGAFIIIAVLLFPYFPNLSPDTLQGIVDDLKMENQGLSDDLDNQKAQNASLQATIDNQKQQIADAQSQATSAQNQVNQLQAALTQAQSAGGDKDKQIADLIGQLDGTAFLGVEPTSESFQLILDMSGSIEEHTDKVEAIVSTVLSRMNAGKEIQIMTYKGDVSAPFISYWPNSSSFAQSLTTADIQSAQNFVRQELNNAGGGTPTFAALGRALMHNKPTSIILVTDGLPQVRDGEDATRYEINQAVRDITFQNAGRHQINIIGTGQFSDPNLDDLLAAQALSVGLMSTQNGGALVAIP